MSQSTTRTYPAEFQERAVTLAVESDQPLAQTARDLGVHENTLPHLDREISPQRHGRRSQFQDEHLYDELKRLGKENSPLEGGAGHLKKGRGVLRTTAAM